MTLVRPKECVVFDANAYRSRARGATPAEAIERASRLVALERRAGIMGMGSHDVVIELCTHLADPADPEFDTCLAAMSFMYVHCSWDLATRVRLRLMPTPERQLCEPLFGRVPHQLVENSKQVRLAAYSVYANPTREGVAAHAANLQMVASFAETAEDAYIDVLRDARRWLEENATGNKGTMRELLVGIPGRAMVAGMFVNRARTVLDLHEPDAWEAYNGLWVAEAFPVAIDFVVHRFRALLDGGSPENQGNSSWDGELAFLIGSVCSLIDGVAFHPPIPIQLVTGDRALRESADRCNLGHRCETPEAYRERLRIFAEPNTV